MGGVVRTDVMRLLPGNSMAAANKPAVMSTHRVDSSTSSGVLRRSRRGAEGSAAHTDSRDVPTTPAHSSTCNKPPPRDNSQATHAHVRLRERDTNTAVWREGWGGVVCGAEDKGGKERLGDFRRYPPPDPFPFLALSPFLNGSRM
jgi:hypothetical protein